MSAVDTKGFIDTNQRQENASAKELIKRWFTGGNEISLIRKGSNFEYELFDYRTEKRITTDLTADITALARGSFDSIIESFKKRQFPIIDEEGQYNFRIFIPLQEMKDPKEIFIITLFSRSRENILMWEIFDRTLNASYLLPLDNTYIFNGSFYARYNELKFGGYSSTHETGPKKEYIALSTYKGDKKKKTRYLRDCVVENLKTDEKDGKRITAIFIKKVIAPSKVEVEGPNGRVFIDSDFWLVSLMADGTATKTLGFIDKHVPIEKHASIIVEGIQNAKYFMIKLHIGLPENKKATFAEVRIGDLTNMDFKSSNYLKSWLVKSSLAKKMMSLAMWQQKQQKKGNPQVYFDSFGSGAPKESVIRPFVIKETFESLNDVKQAIILHYKNKKEIMQQKKRFIVFILRYKSECIQTISFPETKSWKAFDKKESSFDGVALYHEDETVQVFEIEHDFKRYSPQHTELFFEYVKSQWLRKIVPDNCITWTIQMLKEIGIYIDKKSFTSPRRTLSNRIPGVKYSLDMISGDASFVFPLQQQEFPLKKVPFLLLIRFNDAMIDKDFDEIGFIIEAVGKMGLSQEAFLLLEISKRYFGNNPYLIEIQLNLAKIIPSFERKKFLLKQTLRNLSQQLDMNSDTGNKIRLLLEKVSEQQKKALEQFEQFAKKPDDPSSIESIKQSFENILKVLKLQNKDYSDLYQKLITQLSMLLKIASNNPQDTIELEESFQTFTNLLEKYIKGYGNEDLLKSFLSLKKWKEQFNESSDNSEELQSFASDLEKIRKPLEITYNNVIYFLEESEIESLLLEAVILCASNDSKAEKNLETTLEKSREFYGDKDPLTLIENLKKIARAFDDLGLKKEAVQIYKEASEILINKYEGKDIELILQRLIELYHSIDEIEIKRLIQKEAQAIINVSFQKALVIFNTSKAQKIISYLIDLAKMASFLELTDQALEIYQEALKMLQNEEYEDKDLIEAELRHGLARLLYLSKRKQAAKIMLEKSFETYKLSLGYDNPRIIEVLEQLVEILVDLNQKKEAKTRFEELISMSKKVYGEDHPRIKIIKDKFQQLDNCIIL